LGVPLFYAQLFFSGINHRIAECSRALLHCSGARIRALFRFSDEPTKEEKCARELRERFKTERMTEFWEWLGNSNFGKRLDVARALSEMHACNTSFMLTSSIHKHI